MRLTMYTDYSLRVMMSLAADPERTWTIQELADGYGISKNHLMKVINALAQAGRVQTVRGRGGGLRLAEGAREIRLGDLVREFEQDFSLVECFGGERGECILDPGCRLKRVLGQALEAFVSVLNDYTLGDLVDRRELRTRLLFINGVGGENGRRGG